MGTYASHGLVGHLLVFDDDLKPMMREARTTDRSMQDHTEIVTARSPMVSMVGYVLPPTSVNGGRRLVIALGYQGPRYQEASTGDTEANTISQLQGIKRPHS